MSGPAFAKGIKGFNPVEVSAAMDRSVKLNCHVMHACVTRTIPVYHMQQFNSSSAYYKDS